MGSTPFARTPARVTRFRRGALAVVLLATLLAACDTGGGEDAGGSAESSGNAAFPVTIEHKYGSTTIEEEPERVVVLGLTDIDAVLALGVTPVGFVDWYGEYPKADIRNGLWPWSHDAVGDAEPLLMPRNEDKFNFETVASLRPDIIIAQYTGMTEQEYETASQIAPVVAQTAEFPDFEAPWDDTTRRIGLALGRSDQAEELIEGVQDKFAAARAAHPEFEGKTAMLVGIYEGIIYARGPKEPHGKVFAELGFSYPEQVEALIPSDNVLAELSLEQIELLDCDVLMVGEFDSAGELTGHPLYLNLPVVKEGRVVHGTEPVEGALYWASVASLPFALDHLVPQLAAAVDGNPQTRAEEAGR